MSDGFYASARSPTKNTGARKAPVFIYSAACARKRRPITSIKSQPSRNGMASSLEKSDSTHRVATDLSAEDDVFQHLGDRADAVVGHGVQDVEWGLGVDEQGGPGSGRFRLGACTRDSDRWMLDFRNIDQDR